MKNILVVEDETSLAEMLVSVLEQEGYCAVSKPSGEEALAYCAKIAPDLILSDLKMEGMDGLTLLQNIHALEGLKDVPFVLLSGAREASTTKRAKELGAIAHIQKPVELAQLLKTVQELSSLKM